ncbi:Ubiquitin-conjugating enzyme E2 [Macrophomina phaseolina MS6]|uniref:Ubiquitin-conjugating enzyme E2 n=1 Tax=Macrophomina phaseolina (strain MS6) TaxID=1126212 RepID=K2QPZ7_MACPH|nr:Ubiquitin-conjugating enzyme E2 [Macrophomina phaseolina MS6]
MPGQTVVDTARPAAPVAMAEKRQICIEDTVHLKNKQWLIGVVDRTNHDVDSHEPDPQREYTGEIQKHISVAKGKFEAFLRNGIPPRGTVLVSWQTDFTTELVPDSELVLVDRNFFVGDVVKRDPNSPMSGTVIGTKVEVTIAPIRMWPEVETIRSHVSYERLIGDDTANSPRSLIPAEELETIRQYPEGALIIYDNWVGRIDDAYDEVTLRLSNGTVVVPENSDELTPIDPRLERHEVGDYVRAKKGNLRRGRWIFGAFNANVEPGGVVIDVRTTSITVQWLSRRLGGPPTMPGAYPSEPPIELGLDELESGKVTVYDNMKKPTTTPSSTSTSPSSSTVAIRASPELTPGQRVKFKDLAGACVKYAPYVKKRPRTETLGYDTNIFTVQTTKTTVITQWQDLSTTEDSAVELLPDPNVDDEDEVWPGEIICTNEKKKKETGDQAEWFIEPAKVGVVQTVQGKDRMATVKWFPEASVKFVENDLLPGSKTGVASGEEEKVSLYDIRTTVSLNRRRGDYVIVIEGSLAGDQSQSEDINWFGEVVDLGLNGLLTVRLGAANPVRDITVPAEAVVLAYNADIDPETGAPDHLGDTMSEDEDYDDDMDDESILDDADNYLNMWYEYTGPDGRRIRVEEDNDEDDWATEDEEDVEDESSAEENDVSMEDAGAVDTSKTTPEAPLSAQPPEGASSGEKNQSISTGDGTSESKISEPFSFADYPDAPAAFAILEGTPPEDHHFIRSAQGEPSQQRLRRIQKEHKILGSSLPPGILVRTWESRLDLLRVLIVGPEDTPYEYAPFLVDFHLGPNFPSSPPEAFFHSWTGGLGPVNPNLYEDGKICLSLLGTWHADERNENWSQAKSTILQVLVSLMGLVLVREPYYNEAGYEVRQGTEETTLSSALYSEKAYFRARGFIMHGLLHLPAPFEADIQWLYRKETGPKLLEKAIGAAKDIVERSEQGNGEKRDGLRNISKGAIIPLKRQLAGLERLREDESQTES